MTTKKKWLIAVVVFTVISIGCISVFARQITETISVTYDNIKILIDGIEYTATDVNGTVIEPFIYKGTTYLPVRGIANAFGKDVSWEPQTSTVILGSKNYDWLDQIGYANYETTGAFNKMAAISDNTQSTEGEKINRGLYFNLSCSTSYGAKETNDDEWETWQRVEYLLNNQYATFEGEVVCLENNDYYSAHNEETAILKLYGDGNLIYTSPPISRGTKTTEFKVDVSNYKILKLDVSCPNASYTSLTYSGYYTCVGIAEARLSKK